MAQRSEGGLVADRMFEQHGPAVHRYFRRMTGSVTEADDLAQEVFLRVVRFARDYQPCERERAWLFRIARNVFLDRHRRVARHPLVPVAADAVAPPSQAVGSAVREALTTLLHDDREAFLLAEVGGLTYAEIAAATGSSVPAVRNRIYRARLALRDRLFPPAPITPGAIPRHEDDE